MVAWRQNAQGQRSRRGLGKYTPNYCFRHAAEKLFRRGNRGHPGARVVPPREASHLAVTCAAVPISVRHVLCRGKAAASALQVFWLSGNRGHRQLAITDSHHGEFVL